MFVHKRKSSGTQSNSGYESNSHQTIFDLLFSRGPRLLTYILFALVCVIEISLVVVDDLQRDWYLQNRQLDMLLDVSYMLVNVGKVEIEDQNDLFLAKFFSVMSIITISLSLFLLVVSAIDFYRRFRMAPIELLRTIGSLSMVYILAILFLMIILFISAAAIIVNVYQNDMINALVIFTVFSLCFPCILFLSPMLSVFFVTSLIRSSAMLFGREPNA